MSELTRSVGTQEWLKASERMRITAYVDGRLEPTTSTTTKPTPKGGLALAQPRAERGGPALVRAPSRSRRSI